MTAAGLREPPLVKALLIAAAIGYVAPLLIVTSLEEYDYAGATGIAMVMLGASLLVLLLINWIQHRERVRRGL
jgi:sulfate transport system permease protein